MKENNLTAYPVISGVEILYYRDISPEVKSPSHLKDIFETISISCNLKSNFCFIQYARKKLPSGFRRYARDMEILINIEKTIEKNFKAFTEVLDIIKALPEKFKIINQLCVIKMTKDMHQVFAEMQQIPHPPVMFKFYLQLKVMELVLLLDCLNLYSNQIRFYNIVG